MISTDMDLAVTLIKVANVADAGCDHCVRTVLTEAVRLQPDLPWGMAVDGLAAEMPSQYESAQELIHDLINGDPE